MMKVHHPTLPDCTRDVAESDLDRWLEAGWLKNPPRNAAAVAAREAAESVED